MEQGTLFLEKTKLSLVENKNVKDTLIGFGLEIERDELEDEDIIFLSSEEKFKKIPAKCSGCGAKINLNNFGHLAKGSKLIYCKNPICFNHYIALKKIKERNS